MKAEDLAFVNRQLAAMLKSGMPLEGSLRQLCQDMRRGRLRKELEALEGDLGRGIPLSEALATRRLPELYKRMLGAGLRGQDLPRMLTLLADYYYQQHSLWARLRGLMIYPAIVLAGSLALSLLCGSVFSSLVEQQIGGMSEQMGMARMPALCELIIKHREILTLALWAPGWVLGAVSVGFFTVAAVGPLRRWLRFKVPIVRDTVIAHFASSMGLMLQGGCPFSEAVAFLGQAEAGTPLGRELRGWLERMRAGATRFADVAGERGLFPPFFKWLVASAGEDLPEGFRQAAELYQTRAMRGREFLLYAALPTATLSLGVVIAIQVYTLLTTVIGVFLPTLDLFL